MGATDNDQEGRETSDARHATAFRNLENTICNVYRSAFVVMELLDEYLGRPR